MHALIVGDILSFDDMVCDSCDFCLPGRFVCQETEWKHFSGKTDIDHGQQVVMYK